MWVMTTDGFYSAVRDLHDKDYVFVRARRRGDLDNLNEKLNASHKIIVNPNADYRYRIRLSKREWGVYMFEYAEDIEYHNFKSAVAKVSREHADAYHHVWNVMYDLQITEERDANISSIS